VSELLWWKRRMMSDFKVELVNDNVSEFYVEFRGPPQSAPFFSTLLMALKATVRSLQHLLITF
jgi:hypothetical protein